MELICIAEFIIYFLCISVIITHVCDFTISKTKYGIYGLLYSSIILILYTISKDIFIIFDAFSPIIQIIALYCIFDKNSFGSILYTVIIMYSINALVSSIAMILFDINIQNARLVDFYIALFMNIIYTLLCCRFFKLSLKNIRNWIPLWLKRLLLITLILTTILLVLVFDDTYYADTTAWFQFVQKGILIIAILLIVIGTFLICVMVTNNRLKQLTANYEQQILVQAEHYKRLAESTHELQKFKHDFKNMSFALEKLLNDNKNAEALALFKQYNDTLENPLRSQFIFDTGNGIADALLSDKQLKALACNCNIIFDGVIPANHLLPTDICVILGNTLDNAIEACEKIQTTSPLTITVTCHCNSGFMFLSMTNPVSEKVKVNNNYIATTKENKTLHGFGLYSLHSVVQKYNGNIELKSTDTTFTANIDLCLVP